MIETNLIVVPLQPVQTWADCDTRSAPERLVQWEASGVYHRGRVVSAKVRDLYVAAFAEQIEGVGFLLVQHFYTRQLELVELSKLRPLEYRED